MLENTLHLKKIFSCKVIFKCEDYRIVYKKRFNFLELFAFWSCKCQFSSNSYCSQDSYFKASKCKYPQHFFFFFLIASMGHIVPLFHTWNLCSAVVEKALNL